MGNMKIENKQQYYLAMSEIEKYLEKGFASLTVEEDEQLYTLSQAVESWELAAYPMPINPSLKDILNHIMFAKDINQTQLSAMLNKQNEEVPKKLCKCLVFL
jgi:antitoxin component HigA of HigAB toxin-antitoxin module